MCIEGECKVVILRVHHQIENLCPLTFPFVDFNTCDLFKTKVSKKTIRLVGRRMGLYESGNSMSRRTFRY